MRRSLLSALLLLNILSWSSANANADVSRLLQTADSLVAQAQYDSALAIELIALSEAEQQYDPEDTLVAKVLMYIGAELSGLGRLEEARDRFQRALTIREIKMGADHPRVADCYMNLGIVSQRLQDYERARTSFTAAYRIILSALGPNNPKTVRAAQNLFGFYQHMGEIDSAAVYGNLAVSTSRAVYGPNHFETAVNLANLAVLQIDLQRLDLAETNLEEAVAILDSLEPIPGIQLQQAVFLNNLGNVFSELNKHKQALDSYQRALRIREPLLGSDHPDVAITLGNLASTYVILGEWEMAEELNLRALNNFEKFYGTDHSELTYVLVNLGIIYRNQGDLVKSREYYERALKIRTKAFGRIHPKVATVLYNLATLTGAEGNISDAIALQTEAMNIRESLFGDRNPSVAECQEHLSHLYRQTENFKEALELATKAELNRRQHQAQISAILSEREALAFSTGHRRSLGNLTGCYLDAPKSIQSLYSDKLTDALISSKGIITDQMAQVYRWMAETDDPVVLELIDKLKITRNDMADLYIKGPTEKVEKFRQSVNSLQVTMEGYESELVTISERYRQELERSNITTSQLVGLLPLKTALFEYFRVEIPTLSDYDLLVPFYLALTVQRDSEPQLINLGPVDEIDSLTDLLHNHMLEVAALTEPTAQDKLKYFSIATSLAKLILYPLLKQVPEGSLILVAPDGTLNTISFSGLPYKEDQYLIEAFPVHYISAGRDLIRLNQPRTFASGLLAIGDPDFNFKPDQTPSTPVATQKASNITPYVPQRSFTDDCDDLRDLLASPLPSTAKELNAITAYWKLNKTSKPTILTGQEATESNFKRYAVEKNTIHIATHGFFVGKSCAKKEIDANSSNRLTFQSDNPLLFSGLLFAGANRRLTDEKPSETTDDGLLTALEVSNLNLSGTRMVVLSACETGLGTVENGEGLFGLKRAFQLAGAATVISSLWPVSDESTSSLLGSLYTATDADLPHRLQALQLDFINKMRSKTSNDHPFNWAAFTVQGDW